jgi:hypothetical protein
MSKKTLLGGALVLLAHLLVGSGLHVYVCRSLQTLQGERRAIRRHSSGLASAASIPHPPEAITPAFVGTYIALSLFYVKRPDLIHVKQTVIVKATAKSKGNIDNAIQFVVDDENLKMEDRIRIASREEFVFAFARGAPTRAPTLHLNSSFRSRFCPLLFFVLPAPSLVPSLQKVYPHRLAVLGYSHFVVFVV